MPRFKSINFYQIGLKLSYFAKKYKIFERWGLRPQTSKTAPRNCKFLAMRLSLIRFLLISMPPVFSLMPRFKSIYLCQNKPKIKFFLQNNKILGAPLPDLQWPPADLPDP